ncbi:MAG: serine/threonine-protein kinase [Geodermatophilaceae bacterium]
MAVAPGRQLGQRYELRSLIATGGMGQVWRAEDTTLHRTVAVKVLRSEYTGDPTFLERFRAEARNTAALSHPNIANIYDYGEANDGAGETVAYLVMELVDGEPLSQILAREGRLDPERTLHLLGQAAAGLDAAHRAGVVHRDVKPGNVLVRPDDTVKITDFGIARAASTVPLTQTGMIVGTAHYLSPEQAEGRITTPASDVYSLGIVGYECLAGQRPFDGGTSVAIALQQIRDQPPPLPPDVPEPVRELIGRSLDKDARLRFATGGEFAAAIAAVRAGRPLGPGPTSGPSQATGLSTQVIGGAGAAAGIAGARGPGTRAMPVQAAAREPLGPPPGPPRYVGPAPLAPEPRRSNAPWYLLLVVALLVLAGVIGLVVAQNMDQSGGGTDPGVSGSTATSTQPGQTSTSQTASSSAPSSAPTTTASTTDTTTTTTTTATTTDTTTSATTTATETVTISAGDYRGQNVDSVVSRLEGLGLVANSTPVEDQRVNDGTIAEGTVGTITPDGTLNVGTTVTVPYAVPVPTKGKGKGKGNG